MRRRTWALVAGAVLAAVTVTGVVVASGAEQATSAAQDSPASTVAVERRKLAATVSLNGTLTYRAQVDGSPYSVINQAGGIYTELPADGDRIDCGDVMYRVDDEPVLLLCGAVPAYRDLAIGDEGNDVAQLNRSLHELGYDAVAAVAIDPGVDVFGWETQQALEALQQDMGLEMTGALAIDDAVFLPRPARIARVTGRLGAAAAAGGQVAQATSDTLEVQVELGAWQQDEVERGDRARITLPGNRSVTGRVVRLGKVARTAGEDDEVGDATIPAYIALDAPRRARGLDQAPVQVDIATEGVTGALSVPVTALVGRSGGGFAVEVLRAGGRRELVAVRLGLFDTADGRVAVEGELDEGERVVVPSP